MADSPNLVTTCTFKGREFVLKMNVLNGSSLEVSATDKFSAEEWNCCFDATFIENQTRKTGNFKHFEVFVTMLRSGLLKSSDCVSVDLLTFEDLELLRSRRFMGQSAESTSRSTNSNHSFLQNANKRYLILTYIVEFDRVHYPLPLEYCGPPDPQVLQSIIRRLEAEVSKLREQLAGVPRSSGTNDKIKFLEHKVDQLMAENQRLTCDVQLINRAKSKLASSERRAEELEKQLHIIEETYSMERKAHSRLVGKLREEKSALIRRLNSLEGPAKVMSSKKSASKETEGIILHSTKHQSSQELGSETKRSTGKNIPEQTRLEEMRTSLRKYSKKLSSNGQPASKCRSDDSLLAAIKCHPNNRSRSCSASSRASSKKSQARDCCPSPKVNSTSQKAVKPRGRSRSRRTSSASSGGSALIQAPRSRNGSVSSGVSICSAHSVRSNSKGGNGTDSNGTRKVLKKCGNAKMKTVKDLELRINKLQKLLEESRST